MGREGELARIREFLDAVHTASAALILEGTPGIGKTTLWSAGVGLAEDRSSRVLVHGAIDESIPVGAAEDFHQVPLDAGYRGEPRVLEGIGHSSLVSENPSFAESARQWERCLLRPPGSLLSLSSQGRHDHGR